MTLKYGCISRRYAKHWSKKTRLKNHSLQIKCGIRQAISLENGTFTILEESSFSTPLPEKNIIKSDFIITGSKNELSFVLFEKLCTKYQSNLKKQFCLCIHRWLCWQNYPQRWSSDKVQTTQWHCYEQHIRKYLHLH